MASTSFVNPSNLSFSPSASFSPASPASSASPSHEDDDHDDIDPGHLAGPSRKRSRTSAKDESSSTAVPSVSEQRKEARAHRNRIAAQNSRDRRKAQFTYLERRVVELEEENRRLRSGVVVPVISNVVAPPATATLSSAIEDHLRAEREKERERENEELKDRIKTLERGWDAVVKALAAQGVASGLITPTQPQATTSPAPQTQTKLDAPTQPTFTAFPSPAPSHSSLDFESSLPPPSSLSLSSSSPITDFLPMVPSPIVAPTQPQTSSQQPQAHVSHPEPTRHLARVATTGGPSLVRSVSLQRVVSGAVQGTAVEGAAAITTDDDDTAMEALFREILASPRAAHSVVPVQGAAGVAQVTSASGALEEEEEGKEEGKEGEELVDVDTDSTDENINNNSNNSNNTAVDVAEWANEIEMQRMLDSIIMDNGELGMLGLGGIEMNLLDMDMDMDLVAYDAGVVGDYSRAPWEINSASVF